MKTWKSGRIVAVFFALAACIILGLTSTAMAATSGDYEFTVDSLNKATITDYTGSASTVIIPSKLNGYTVETIGSSSFSFNLFVSEVTIPNGVKKIEYSAFAWCNNLKTVTIPRTVWSIDSFAFNGTDLQLIKGYAGTAAQTFAQNKGIMFEALPYPPPEVTDITVNKTNIVVGETVTGTISSIYGTPPLLYGIDVYEGDTKVYEGPWESTNEFSCIFTYPGTFDLVGYVMDDEDRQDSMYVTINVSSLSIDSVNADKTSSVIGSAITWTTTATGGSGTKTYCFQLYKDDELLVSGNYGTARTYTYTPTAAGTYSVRGYVKDSIGTVSMKSADVIVYAPLSITSVIADKTSADIGTAITWTTTAAGGSGTKTYLFKLYKGAELLVSGSYGAAGTYSYTPTAAGTYSVIGYVKDSTGTVSMKSADVIVKVPLAISSVTCSKTSAAAYESATYTINTTGGKTPLSYCFYVYKNGVVFYKGSYIASNTYTYTFSSAGSYKVQGYVKDANNAKVSKYSAVINVTAPAKPVISSVTCSKTSAAVGESATFTINATGGKAPLGYCFYVYKNGVAIYKGTFGTSKTYTYTFSSAGSYKVQGYVKDANSAKASKYSAVINVTAPAQLAISSVTCSKTSAVANESATYTINTTGGKAPLSYCFYIFKNGVAIYKGSYGTSKTYTYTFSSVGSYKVQGYVKDANNAKASKYSAVINVTAPGPLAISSVTCSKNSAVANESATYTINTTGGKAPFSYCFYIFKNGVAIYKGSYGTSKTYTYTFSSVGSYKVQGYVKDANNAKASKYSAVINVTAPGPLAISSVTCSKTGAAAGESATYTINTTGGKAPLSYCFYVFKNGVAIYKGSYIASNTYTYTFTSAGSYKVQGYVKDANNAKVSKYSSTISVVLP